MSPVSLSSNHDVLVLRVLREGPEGFSLVELRVLREDSEAFLFIFPVGL